MENGRGYLNTLQVIIHKRSGSQTGTCEQIAQLLRRPGLVVLMKIAQPQSQLAQLAGSVAREEDRLIVVGSGDGTVSIQGSLLHCWFCPRALEVIIPNPAVPNGAKSPFSI